MGGGGGSFHAIAAIAAMDVGPRGIHAIIGTSGPMDSVFVFQCLTEPWPYGHNGQKPDTYICPQVSLRTDEELVGFDIGVSTSGEAGMPAGREADQQGPQQQVRAPRAGLFKQTEIVRL